MSQPDKQEQLAAEVAVSEATAEVAKELSNDQPVMDRQQLVGMISSTSKSITKFVETLRQQEAGLEQARASECARFEAERARVMREHAQNLERLEKNSMNKLSSLDEDLTQVRYTLSAIEPARAKLAERAAVN